LSSLISEVVLLRLLSRYSHPAALTRIAGGAAVFPVLRRLERDCLVSRRRGLYRLTVRGRSELELQPALARSVDRALTPWLVR